MVPPDDVLGRNGEGELEGSDESEQEAFHPAEGEGRLVRDGYGEESGDGLYEGELIADAGASAAEEGHDVAPHPRDFGDGLWG